jgi:putative ABC transport system ATP-binding protein
MPPDAIHTMSLVKIYGTGNGVSTKALDGVDIRIARGEFVAIVGPSGSGKSTLLNMLGALDVPTSGKVYIDGIDITGLNASQLATLRNRKIGFIFQSFNLIARMTALENVALPLALQGVAPKERRRESYETLKQVGLEHRWRHKPTALSGGEQQRVAVARALASNPSILLGDEPTGNLDTKNTNAITKMLKDLNHSIGKTIIVITHNLEVANEADRIIFIRDGKVERDEKTTPNGVEN